MEPPTIPRRKTSTQTVKISPVAMVTGREHKTSMLQDLERGRPMEIDALVSAAQELGRLADKVAPAIDAVSALVRRLAVERGCYG